MYKKDIIAELKRNFYISNVVSAEIVNSIIDFIKDQVRCNNKVVLRGFGTFKLSLRKARVGMNPQTKKPMKIEQKYVPVFKASKNFKKELQLKVGRFNPKKFIL